MKYSEVRTITKARKRHCCDWCNEVIEKGESYHTWFCFDERSTAKLHPECYDAMNRHLNETDEWEIELNREFQRGCTEKEEENL